MNKIHYRDWLQILGQFGVVASLLFVGMQIKQDHEIAQSVAYQERSTVAAEFYWSIASDEVARSAMSKILNGETELTAEETDAALWFWRSGKELLQNSYYQYQNGYLDDEHWDQIRRLIKRNFEHPVTRSVLLDGNSRPSFQEILIEIEAEVKAESSK